MDDRGARLLPRLFSALDTLENDGEIANAVRSIRAIAGERAFSVALKMATEDEISLSHTDQRITARLRGLGMLLRHAQAEDPWFGAAVQRAQQGMIDGTSARRTDLLVAIGYLPKVLAARADEAGQVGNVPVMLRETMHELWSLMGRL